MKSLLMVTPWRLRTTVNRMLRLVACDTTVTAFWRTQSQELPSQNREIVLATREGDEEQC